MVKAEITLGTCYGDAVIPVEVLGKGPRPGTAWVRALNGLEPFTKISHGGPFQDSTSVVLIPHLRDVRIESDPGKAGGWRVGDHDPGGLGHALQLPRTFRYRDRRLDIETPRQRRRIAADLHDGTN